MTGGTQYAQRRAKVLAARPAAACADCGAKFKSKRGDARFCSDRCRQRAHRKVVTDKNKTRSELLFIRDDWKQHILTLIERHRAIYLNDLLPATRTRAQYQQLCRVAADLKDAGKIETRSYWSRFGRPGHKALVKLGHKIENRDEIHRLTNNERLKCGADNRPAKAL